MKFSRRVIFTLSPACSSAGNVIDVAGDLNFNGANVQLYNSNGTLAQLFSFVYYDGYYVIRNVKSQNALDVDGGNLIPGTKVQQWACDSENANRLFAAVDNGDGPFSFVSKSTGLALDIVGASDSAQAKLDAYLLNGTAAQKFSLHRVGEFLDEDAFSLESDTSSKVLDVSGGSMKDGAAVQLYASNGTRSQKRYLSNITVLQTEYEIKCIGSRKVFSLTDGGEQVELTSSGADFQRWRSALSCGKIAPQYIATVQRLWASGSSTSLGMADRTNGDYGQYTLVCYSY